MFIVLFIHGCLRDDVAFFRANHQHHLHHHQPCKVHALLLQITDTTITIMIQLVNQTNKKRKDLLCVINCILYRVQFFLLRYLLCNKIKYM